MKNFTLTEAQIEELEIPRKAYYEKLRELNVAGFDVSCNECQDSEDGDGHTVNFNMFATAQEHPNGSCDVPEVMRAFALMISDSDFCLYMLRAAQYYTHADELHRQSLIDTAMLESQGEQRH